MFLPKGIRKERKKTPMLRRDHRLPSSCFALKIAQRSKLNTQACLLEILRRNGEMWSEQSAKDKQPYEQKVAKLKEKYEKDIAAYRAKGKSEAGKKGPGRPTGSKKNEPEDEEEEEEEEEEEDEEEEEEDEE